MAGLCVKGIPFARKIPAILMKTKIFGEEEGYPRTRYPLIVLVASSQVTTDFRKYA